MTPLVLINALRIFYEFMRQITLFPSPLANSPISSLPVFLPFSPLSQQVQQQAALMASVGQGGYLSPMAAYAAAQMQHMATINGIPGAPMTPTSGEGVQVSGVRGLQPWPVSYQNRITCSSVLPLEPMIALSTSFESSTPLSLFFSYLILPSFFLCPPTPPHPHYF